MPRYLLLMLEDDNAWDKLPKDRQQALYQQYVAYTASLRDTGRLIDGAPLGQGTLIAPGPPAHADPKPAPDTRTQAVPTGYFVFEADDLDHATQLAAQCPALTHGETVTVQPLGGDS